MAVLTQIPFLGDDCFAVTAAVRVNHDVSLLSGEQSVNGIALPPVQVEQTQPPEPEGGTELDERNPDGVLLCWLAGYAMENVHSERLVRAVAEVVAAHADRPVTVVVQATASLSPVAHVASL
jgi:hypothetical protein